MTKCIFCDIVAHKQSAAIIHEDDQVISFLDRRPLFPGHTLLIPKIHYETLLDLPDELGEFFFKRLKQTTKAVKEGMVAQGAFVAMNNVISQSVPHFHVHIVPRRQGDGLKGFFWPRHPYQEGEMEEVAEKLRAAWNSQSDS